MGYEQIIQSVLDEIDKRITENIGADELARTANYSVHHFRRVFMELTGMPFMHYITRRKLEYALYDLSQGRRIIDAAMDYGFETHAGFTKAFKKHFGYPPSLYRLHVSVSPPKRATVNNVKLKHGGINMQVQIKELTPFAVVGYASRHKIPGVKNMANLPGF
jgi:AraC family transcriptional regulator